MSLSITVKMETGMEQCVLLCHWPINRQFRSAIRHFISNIISDNITTKCPQNLGQWTTTTMLWCLLRGQALCWNQYLACYELSIVLCLRKNAAMPMRRGSKSNFPPISDNIFLTSRKWQFIDFQHRDTANTKSQGGNFFKKVVNNDSEQHNTTYLWPILLFIAAFCGWDLERALSTEWWDHGEGKLHITLNCVHIHGPTLFQSVSSDGNLSDTQQITKTNLIFGDLWTFPLSQRLWPTIITLNQFVNNSDIGNLSTEISILSSVWKYCLPLKL